MSLIRNPDTIRAAAEERRADRAAKVQIQRQQLLLAEEKRQAAQREKAQARFARQQARTEKRQRRAVRAAKVRAAFPTVGRRVLIVGPILAPMTVAWVGQIQFATGTLAWPLLAALVFAASWELTTAFAGWMFHQARQAGDRGLQFRAATWLFAASAGAMNYWHALDGKPVTNPTPAAVSYGAMSLVGIGLWELYTSLIHRQHLRDTGRLPAARPRFGAALWVRYTRITWTAWSLTIRDRYTTLDEAWAAALSEIARKDRAKAQMRAADAGQIPVRVTVVHGHRTLVSTARPGVWNRPHVVWIPAVSSRPPAVETTPADHPSDASQATPEPMVRTIDKQVVPTPAEPPLQTMVPAADETTPAPPAEPMGQDDEQTTERTTRRTSTNRRARTSKPRRWTNDQLKAELEQIVADHYRNGGGEIEVNPIAKRLKVGRPRVRKLLDEMNVRPIRKAVNG